MEKKLITIELDDETLRCRAMLGQPIEVLTKLAQSAADGVRIPPPMQRTHTDESLRVERNKADIAIPRNDFLTVERGATDRALTVERADADTTMVDQREANAHMVSATIRAHELTVEADAAKARAEQSEPQPGTRIAWRRFSPISPGMLSSTLRPERWWASKHTPTTTELSSRSATRERPFPRTCSLSSLSLFAVGSNARGRERTISGSDSTSQSRSCSRTAARSRRTLPTARHAL